MQANTSNVKTLPAALVFVHGIRPTALYIPRLKRCSPRRGVDDEAHDAAGDDGSRWQSDDPAGIRPGNHPPVDSLDVARAQTDTDGGADDALGRGHRQRQTGGQHHGQRGTKLHAETTRRRVQRDAVAQVAHEVVAVRPETDGDGGTSEHQDPDGHGRVLAGGVGLPDVVDGGQRAHGVGDVVGAVGERRGGGGHDLQEGKEVLDFGVVVHDARVLVLEVLAYQKTLKELGLAGRSTLLLVDDVHHDAAEEEPFDGVEDLHGLVPLALGGSRGCKAGGGDGGADCGCAPVASSALLFLRPGDLVGVAVDVQLAE